MIESSGSRDIDAFTGLRGIAALYVVAYHYNPGATPFGQIFVRHGYLAVDLFFVLSGFVMALNYKYLFLDGFSISSYIKFIGRRFARIYPIYFLSTIFAFLLIYMNFDPNVRFSVSHPVFLAFKLMLNFSLMQAWVGAGSIDGPAWSLSTELAAYLLFPLLLVPCLFQSPKVACFAALFCFIILVLLCCCNLFYLHEAPAWTFDLWRGSYELPVLRCLAEFSLGILCYRFSVNGFGIRFRKNAAFAVIVAFMVWLLLCFPKTDLLIAMLLPWLVISASGGKSHLVGRFLSSRFSMFFGRLSYSIYLFHTLFLYFVPAFAEKFGGIGTPVADASSRILALTLTIVVAEISYSFVEVPSRRWLRIILDRNIRSISDDTEMVQS